MAGCFAWFAESLGQQTVQPAALVLVDELHRHFPDQRVAE